MNRFLITIICVFFVFASNAQTAATTCTVFESAPLRLAPASGQSPGKIVQVPQLESEIMTSAKVMAPTNDNCASATALTSGAAPLCAQTTDGGTVQGGEVTAAASVGASAAFAESVWYTFTATSTKMFVQWEFTGLASGVSWCPGKLSMVVYNSSTCLPAAASIIATESSAADGAIVINLTGLTVGNTYLVQLGYNGAMGCNSPVGCMRVGNTPTPCSCASPCTAGCGYSTTPTVAQVTSTCPEYSLIPVSDGGDVENYCYSFTANTTTVNFSMIITSNCGAGNVSALTWTLQTSACGANVATGSLASMSASGLTPGQGYVLCYNYTIPSTCHHSSLYPYFVGAVPLPIELASFDVIQSAGAVKLLWVTESEEGNDFFTIERTPDGKIFEILGTVKGAINSHEKLSYSFEDPNPYSGVSYYRLKQTDLDGTYKYSDLKTVSTVAHTYQELSVIPNPSSNEVKLKYTCGTNEQVSVKIYDHRGTMVKAIEMSCSPGENGSIIDISQFEDGIFLIVLNTSNKVYKTKMVKRS